MQKKYPKYIYMHMDDGWKKLHYFLANLSLFFVIMFKVDFWFANKEVIKRKPPRKLKFKPNKTHLSKDLLLYLEVEHLLWLGKWAGAATSKTAVKEHLEETEGGVTSQKDKSEEQLRAHFLS